MIKIIGYGAVTQYATDVTELKEMFYAKKLNIQKGCSNEIDFEFFDPQLLVKCYKMDDTCKYILEAVRQALIISKLNINEYRDKSKIGVIVASETGLSGIQRKYMNVLNNTGKTSSILFRQSAHNLMSSIISYYYGITGFNTTIFGEKNVSYDALELGMQLLQADISDIMIIVSANSIRNNIDVANGGAFALILKRTNEQCGKNIREHNELFIDKYHVLNLKLNKYADWFEDAYRNIYEKSRNDGSIFVIILFLMYNISEIIYDQNRRSIKVLNYNSKEMDI